VRSSLPFIPEGPLGSLSVGKHPLMANLAERLDPKTVEQEARALWAAQRLPPASGLVGPSEGPVVHQFEGTFAPLEAGMLAVQRAVAADVDARAMILTGRRANGLLRQESSATATPTPRLATLLLSLGVWVGGRDGRTWDNTPRREEVQRIVGRLAHMGAIAVRDVSLRICPACAMARSPETLVYREEDGQTLLVRFPFATGDRPVSALVWTDAAWRLLGTSVLMVHPDLPYVIARYQRRGTDELVFTSKASLARIREWLPGAEFEILEEHPGRHWEGQAYLHPLRHEFPMGGSMDPPAGTIVPVADVSDSGTGVVPLVPGHGGTDTQIADRLGVPGWPLVTPKGRFDVLIVHKYAGLELESATEFAERDLAEEGAIFARLQVRRGVPHCARCGTPLIWAPARAWCLEPSRLPADKVSIYRSLLPNDRPIEQLEAVPWPVSEPQRSEDPLAISLLECTSCDRLEAPGLEAERCTCGGRRRAVRRRLLPAFDAAASAWGSADPFPSADSVRLYTSERRRAPALVHHIAAMSGVVGTPGEVRLSVLPTVPEADFPALLAGHGADAVRCALVRAQASEGATATFAERCAQESRRLEAFWRVARDVLGRLDSSSISNYSQPIGGFLGEFEPEDRALLARFERMRIQCLVDFDRSAPGLVHRRLFQFLENDLETYRHWVAPRLALEGTPALKRGAVRTLAHVIRGTTLVLGPIAPFLAESLHRALRRGGGSLFEEAALGVDRSLLDENRAKSWDRWAAIVRSVERTRRRAGVPPGIELPALVLLVDSDATGAELRAEAPTIARLVHAAKVEVGTPSSPWPGRRRQLRPREAEIQRVYSSRATQLIHLLKRMPERKAVDVDSPQGFTMVVNGQPTQILPSMVEWVETLPEHFVPSSWNAGEMYLGLPATTPAGGPSPPPLSPDGFRLVERVTQRLRSRPAGTRPAVIVAAGGALGSELETVTAPLAKFLDVTEFRVVGADDELPRSGRGYGRTKGGQAWSFHISGLPPTAAKHKIRPERVRGARLRPAFAPGELAPAVLDYGTDERIAREASVRSLGDELDRILGAPLLGPAKVGIAWEAGFRSVESYRDAPWEQLAALPGFGPPLATALVVKFGGTVPPPPPRIRPIPTDDGNGHRVTGTLATRPSAIATTPSTAAPPGADPIAPPSLPAPSAAPSAPVALVQRPEPEVPERSGEEENHAGTPMAVPDLPEPAPTDVVDDEPSGAGSEPATGVREGAASPGPLAPDIVASEDPATPVSSPTAESEIVEIPPARSEMPLPDEDPRMEVAPPPAPTVSVPAPLESDAGAAAAPSVERMPEVRVESPELSAAPPDAPAAPLSPSVESEVHPPDEPVAVVSSHPEPGVPVLEATPPEPVDAETDDAAPLAAAPPIDAPSPPETDAAVPVLAEGVETSAELPPPEHDLPVPPSPPEGGAVLPTVAAPESVVPAPASPDATPPAGQPSSDAPSAPATDAALPSSADGTQSPRELPPHDVETPPPAPTSEAMDDIATVPDPQLAAPTRTIPEMTENSTEPTETPAPTLSDAAEVPAATLPEVIENPAVTTETPYPTPSEPAEIPAATLPEVTEPPTSTPPEATEILAPELPDSAPDADPSAPLASLPPVEPTDLPEAEPLAPSLEIVTPPVSQVAPEPVLPVEPPAAVPTPTGGFDLTVGTSYIPALERFLEATAAGHRGICIVRDSPERVRAYIGSRPVELRWLTNIGRGLTLKPNDLDGLSGFLAHAVSEGQVTAFFLEGVEYLIRIHGLEKVVQQLTAFDLQAKEHSARVWVPLNPKLLSPAELERLTAAFGGAPAVS
jgi:hypothetical protein